MEIKEKISLPRTSLFFLSLIGVGAVAAFLFIFLPKKEVLSDLKKEILNIHSEIEEQKRFQAIEKELQSKIASSKVTNFTLVKSRKLTINDVERAPLLIRDMVTESNLNALFIEPDINSLSKRPGYLLIKAVVQGENEGFREFLVKMRRTPYVDYFERIQLKGSSAGKEFRVHVWLRVG